MLQARLPRVALLEYCLLEAKVAEVVDVLVAEVDEPRKLGSSSDVVFREWLRGFFVPRSVEGRDSRAGHLF